MVCQICGKENCYLGVERCLENQCLEHPLIPYITNLEKRIDELKERIARLAEQVFGMTFEEANAIVNNYVEAQRENPTLDVHPSVLKAEKMLGV